MQFNGLRVNKKIKYDKKYKDDYEEHIITNNINTDYSVFRKEELEIINKVKEKFKDYKVKEIEDFSHKEQAYKKTAYTSKISYDYALDLNIDQRICNSYSFYCFIYKKMVYYLCGNLKE